MLLKVDDIHVHYGPVAALRGVSLEVGEADFVTLIGSNGAGKSTTLRTISGLSHPSAGQIVFDGNRIDPDVLREDIGRPRSRVVVAEPAAGTDAAGEMLACAHVADVHGAGYFGMFAVRPGLQRAGVGNDVLVECERIARDDWGLPAMRMTVIDLREELIAWYERRGYRRTGTFKPFPYGDPRFGIPKRDDLRFEVLEKPL